MTAGPQRRDNGHTHCYELYAQNKDGKKVEIYYDTVSGKPVKSETQD